MLASSVDKREGIAIGVNVPPALVSQCGCFLRTLIEARAAYKTRYLDTGPAVVDLPIDPKTKEEHFVLHGLHVRRSYAPLPHSTIGWNAPNWQQNIYATCCIPFFKPQGTQKAPRCKWTRCMGGASPRVWSRNGLLQGAEDIGSGPRAMSIGATITVTQGS